MINITIPNDDYILNRNEINKLPEKAGIYRLYNNEGILIYIGKTIHLKTRLSEHIKGLTNTSEHSDEIDTIKAFLVGDELYLDLYETYLINKLNPKYNKAKILVTHDEFKKNMRSTLKKDNFINKEEQLFFVLDDFIFDCQARGLSQKTLKTYRNGVLLFLKYVYEKNNITNVINIKIKHIREYLVSKNNTTNRYTNTILKNLRAFFKFCIENKYIDENPMLAMKWAKEEKNIIEIFNDDEVNRLIKANDFSDYLSARDKAIIAFFFDTGIRASELISIKLEHIFEDRVLIKGKGKKERYILLSDVLKKYLVRYNRIKYIRFGDDSKIDDNYFLSNTGKKLTVEANSIAKVRECVRCSPHTARHYFATKMLKNTKDIYTVSRLLGHSNLLITERYLQSINASKIIDALICKTPLESIG